MERILAVIGIWIVCLGAPYLYMQSRQEPREIREFAQKAAEGVLALSITPAFEAVPDPFALQVAGSPAPASISLMLNGQSVLHRTSPAEAGAEIAMDQAQGLVVGPNEFYLAAYPSLEASTRANAVRVRVLRDGRPIADRTFWSEPGTPVAEAFQIEIEEQAESKADDSHGH